MPCFLPFASAFASSHSNWNGLSFTTLTYHAAAKRTTLRPLAIHQPPPEIAPIPSITSPPRRPGPPQPAPYPRYRGGSIRSPRKGTRMHPSIAVIPIEPNMSFVRNKTTRTGTQAEPTPTQAEPSPNPSHCPVLKPDARSLMPNIPPPNKTTRYNYPERRFHP